MANSNSGGILYTAALNQETDLNTAAFAALTWVAIGGMGSLGEAGTKTNILTYDTWDTTVIQKAKGMSDAGSPEIEVSRNTADPGQDLLRIATTTNLNYAFRLVRNDKLTLAGTGTIIYMRGLVTGPVRPNGRNEDFDLEVFTLGLQQREIVVDAT